MMPMFKSPTGLIRLPENAYIMEEFKSGNKTVYHVFYNGNKYKITKAKFNQWTKGTASNPTPAFKLSTVHYTSGIIVCKNYHLAGGDHHA